MNAFRPIHPGEILREEFLIPLNLTAEKAAKRFDLDEAMVRGLANETRIMDEFAAVALEGAFGSSAAFWLNLQRSYDAEIARG